VDSFLDSLNPQQREAVAAPEGPALVLAGAGSGKTRVLTGRAYYLIAHYKVNPNSILVMTFTNKAAGELQERLRGLLGAADGVPWAGTFHSFCARLLRMYAADLNLPRDFTIYDSADSDQIVSALLAERKISRDEVAPAAMRSWISLLKNGGALTGRHSLIKEAPAMLELYNQRLRTAGAVDFDDLLGLPADLFRKRPDILERVQRRYDHVLIDEFQDTNRIQYDLALALAMPQRNLYVVGDDDQSIYGWRGADYRNVFAFQQDLKGAQVFRLEQNYRSTQPILDVANDVIAVNRDRSDKKLWTENKTGEKAVLRQVSRSSDEAHEVIGEIHHLVRSRRHSYKDVAILFRTNALSRPFEEVLISQAIPYTIVGGTRFYERKEIKDLIAFLRLMVNPDDEQAWRRVLQTPPRGIGITTIQQLEQEAHAAGRSIGWVLENFATTATLPKLAKAKLAPVAEFIAALRARLTGLDLVQKVEVVLEASGLIPYYEHYNEEEAEDRLTNLGQLVEAARDRLKEHPDYDLTEFLSEVALVSDIDDYERTADRVTLMTLHSAKGLEYPVVFIVGVEEKLLPHSRSMSSPSELEEERRLFYVGLTRARERLYLTYSQTRYLNGHLEFQEPSRFLRDIAPEHIRGWSLPGRISTSPTLIEDEDQSYSPPERPVYRPQRTVRPAVPTQPGLTVFPYQIGDLVEHPDFGRGVVTAKSGGLDDLKIRVSFEGMGSKLLAVKFAQLKKVP
jgi:DNA helicase II / ATP-dependent DNA helicase PcrA